VRTLPLLLARGVDTFMDRTVAPGYTKIGPAVRSRLPGWPEDPPPQALAGRTAAVTGATSGLGFATARGLARLGADLRVVARDVEKGAVTRSRLEAEFPGVQVAVDRCDVSDLDDVRRFASELDLDRLDVLVHNAGVMPQTRTESAQGHELSMAVHVLGPLLMTELLRATLRRSSGSRVVLVSSGGMYGQRLRADDPEFTQGEYSPTAAYARSKRAQIELLPVLAARWSEDRIGVHATHPGWADTPGVVESLPGFHRLTGPLLRDADGGADTTVWLAAVAPQPGSGDLWHDRRARPTHLLRRTQTGEAERTELWDWARDQAGLDEAS
jgi:NAD(P)-dependent dehydrogenase (short-subunit alcohol dehydrogenase family)